MATGCKTYACVIQQSKQSCLPSYTSSKADMDRRTCDGAIP